MRDYLSEFLTTRPENAGALESGNRQNRQKPDEKQGDAYEPEPTKPTEGTFDAFVGDPSQARASFSPSAADRPRLGSAARPMVVQARRLISCPYGTCGGNLLSSKNNLRQCATCGNWFKLTAPDEDLAAYVTADARISGLGAVGKYKLVTTADIFRAAEKHARLRGHSAVNEDGDVVAPESEGTE